MKAIITNIKEDALQIKGAKEKKDMRNHSQDPFFVKKLEAAKSRVSNLHLPKELTD